MNKESKLNMFISKEAHWFELENVTMPEITFNRIIDEIQRVSNELYKETGSQQFIKKEDTGEVKIYEAKVPNVIKSLVQNPSHDIQITLTGITPDKEKVTEVIKKPLDINKVLKLIPAYHGIKTNQEQQKVSKKR